MDLRLCHYATCSRAPTPTPFNIVRRNITAVAWDYMGVTDDPSENTADNTQRAGMYYIPFNRTGPIIIRSPNAMPELSEAPRLSAERYLRRCSSVTSIHYEQSHITRDFATVMMEMYDLGETLCTELSSTRRQSKPHVLQVQHQFSHSPCLVIITILSS